MDCGIQELSIGICTIIVCGALWKTGFVWTIHINWKNWMIICKDKLLICQETIFIVCQEMFFRRCEACLEARGQYFKALLWSKVSWTAGGKLILNLWWLQASYMMKFAQQLMFRDMISAAL
jgi:hypothetical protein